MFKSDNSQSLRQSHQGRNSTVGGSLYVTVRRQSGKLCSTTKGVQMDPRLFEKSPDVMIDDIRKHFCVSQNTQRNSTMCFANTHNNSYFHLTSPHHSNSIEKAFQLR